jgi:hypothetical protein
MIGRLGPRGRRPLLPVLEDVLGVRRSESKLRLAERVFSCDDVASAATRWLSLLSRADFAH